MRCRFALGRKANRYNVDNATYGGSATMLGQILNLLASRQRDNEERDLTLAMQQLDRLQGFYPRVEAKAAFLLALNLGLIAVAVANFDIANVMKMPRIGGAPIVFLAAAFWVPLLILSTGHLIPTFVPHLRGGMKKSKIFFGDVAATDCAKFIDSWKNDSVSERLTDALIQIWRNSEILRVKYKHADYAYKLSLYSLLPWLVGLASMVWVAGKFTAPG